MPNHSQSTEKTAPVNTDESKLEERKKELIEKLQNFCKSIDLFLDLKLDDISDFVVAEDRLKGRVNCPYCRRKFACFRKTHWAVSNIELHFKKHKDQIIAGKSNEISATPPTEPFDVSGKISSELDSILKD